MQQGRKSQSHCKCSATGPARSECKKGQWARMSSVGLNPAGKYLLRRDEDGL